MDSKDNTDITMQNIKNGNPKRLRLTAKEEEIMRILWDNGPLPVKEMLSFFPEPRPHVNTVSTVVRVLEKKGYIGPEKEGGGYRYHATLAKDNYRKTSLLDMLRNYFDNNLKSLMSALVEEKSPSDEEIQECIDIIEKRK